MTSFLIFFYISQLAFPGVVEAKRVIEMPGEFGSKGRLAEPGFESQKSQDIASSAVEVTEVTEVIAPEQTDMDSFTFTNAEQVFQTENKACAKYFKDGKCLGGPKHHEWNVHMCEEHKMSKDSGAKKCRVSDAWMLIGDQTHDVAWWSELLLALLEAKSNKFLGRCTSAASSGVFWKDWLLGRCKRRMEHVMRSMKLLGKVANGQVKMPVSSEKVGELQSSLKKFQEKFDAAVLGLFDKQKVDAEFPEGKEKFLDLIHRLQAVLAKQGPVTEVDKDRFSSIFKALLKKEDKKKNLEEAEKLIQELEDALPEMPGSNHDTQDQIGNLAEQEVEKVLVELEVSLKTQGADAFLEMREDIEAGDTLLYNRYDPDLSWVENVLISVGNWIAVLMFVGLIYGAYALVVWSIVG